jgi:hypothetical protein
VSALPTPDSPLATRDDIRRLEAMIVALKNQIDRVVHDQDVQFKRIAQLQADIDLVRGAWAKMAARAEATKPSKRRTYVGLERRVTARKK